jgi:peptidoglycan hydrolase-like protein with peptidoglycan-binding domain
MTHSQISLGDKGQEVYMAQQHLKDRGYDPGPVDGIFGPKTLAAVLAYQTFRTADPPPPPHPWAFNWPLHVDGIVGQFTWGRLDPPLTKKGAQGAHVRLLQSILKSLGPAFDPGPIDGIFGPHTESAVKAFQTFMNITVDGEVGPVTWTKLNS